MSRPPLPAMPPCFPPGFRGQLRELLALAPTVRSARHDLGRGRRAATSASGTFVGHRHYVRGDDLRRLDWAVFARSGELFCKQFQEEERRQSTLLLDLSPNLLAGSPPRRPWAWRMAAVLGGVALRHLDGLTVVAPGGGDRAVVTFAGAAGVERLLQHLESLPILDDPRGILQPQLQRHLVGRVHWIADFVTPAALERPLAALHRSGARVTGWLPMLRDDLEVPRRGHLELLDPVHGTRTTVVVDDRLAAAMQRHLTALRQAQDSVFARGGARLERWSVPEPAGERAAWFDLLARCAS